MMRIMGLDYGEKTIGVAVSDELGWTAQGIEVIRRKNKQADLEALRHLMLEYHINEIVIGLPKHMNGTVGERGEMCIAFANELGKHFDLPVQLWDERLTTVAAERTLLEADVSRKKRKQVIDKIAAVFILQGYMDSKNRK